MQFCDPFIEDTYYTLLEYVLINKTEKLIKF